MELEKRFCEICGTQIALKRLSAVPGATQCIECASGNDVPRVKGAMSWEHKTAPELVLGSDAEYLLKNSRRGFHAQLPLNSKENPRMLTSLNNNNVSEGLNIKERPVEELQYEVKVLPAKCHPERRRVSVAGLCFECSVKWYEERKQDTK